ncbi:MAG: phosphate transport system regulatory protein PhoU [Acidobacteria bacterium 13_1_20CM_2_65_9]|jgi:phosphate transport system protein|nr:MAG: phosphate transport system regulatory protein PhoU [Acidobacteria bacterium 13_1_20CM_2_65_9]
MKKFEQELENLKRRVVEMGHTTEEMVALSTSALVDRDQTAIERVLAHEATLDRFQLEIDGEAVRLITIYTPIARDLRFLLMVARINAELERIGDQAVNNCEYVQTLSTSPPGPLSDITQMSEITRGMVHDALEAFNQEDTEKARTVLKNDDDVDRLYNETFSDLLADTSDDADRLSRSMNLILVARSLERIADHATNICEEVIYMVNSEDIRHQR